VIPLPDKLQQVKESIQQDPLIKSLLIMILGLILTNALFSLVFGSGMQAYVGLVDFIVNLLALVIVGAFFWGLYIIIKEQGAPFLQQIQLRSVTSSCLNCGEGLKNNWHCCPFCGRDIKDEGHKN